MSTALKLLKSYAEKKGITISALADVFEVSRQFLYEVLTHNYPCPKHIMEKIKDLAILDKDAVAIMFGYFPDDWIEFTRKDPVAAKHYIEAILRTHHVKNKSPEYKKIR